MNLTFSKCIKVKINITILQDTVIVPDAGYTLIRLDKIGGVRVQYTAQ